MISVRFAVKLRHRFIHNMWWPTGTMRINNNDIGFVLYRLEYDFSEAAQQRATGLLGKDAEGLLTIGRILAPRHLWVAALSELRTAIQIAILDVDIDTETQERLGAQLGPPANSYEARVWNSMVAVDDVAFPIEMLAFLS